MVDRQQDDHACGGVEEAFNSGGHRRFENRGGAANDGPIRMTQENEGPLPRGGVQQGIVGELEIGNALRGVGHDDRKARDRLIRTRRGLAHEPIKGDPGVICSGVEGGQLAVCLGQMAAKPLQVLLHEFGTLGEQHRASHAKDPIHKAVEGAEKTSAGSHAQSVEGNA